MKEGLHIERDELADTNQKQKTKNENQRTRNRNKVSNQKRFIRMDQNWQDSLQTLWNNSTLHPARPTDQLCCR
jgi:hypothetical protein